MSATSGGGPTLTRLTSDTSTTGASYVTTGLSFSVAANVRYVVRFRVFLTTASGTTTANFEIAAVTATATGFIGGGAWGTGPSTYETPGQATATGSDIFGGTNFAFANSPSWFLMLDSQILVGAAAGTFGLAFKSDGTHTATVKAGSWLEYQVIT